MAQTTSFFDAAIRTFFYDAARALINLPGIVGRLQDNGTASGTITTLDPTDRFVIEFPTTGAVTINQISGGVGGRIICLNNAGTGTIVLTNEGAGGTAANRIDGGGSDYTCPAKSKTFLVYSDRLSRWLTPNVTGSGGGMADPGANGVVVRTALNTTVARTLTAGSGISITDGDGVAADPVISFTGIGTTDIGLILGLQSGAM